MKKNEQQLFLDLEEKKSELKDLKSICKQVMESSGELQEVEEKLKALKEKKKTLVSTLNKQCESELIKIEDLKIDIESDQEMLSDVVMVKYTQGKLIELKDKYDNEYEPTFIVKFKKVN